MEFDGTNNGGNFDIEFKESGSFKASMGWDSGNDRLFVYEGGTNSLVSKNGNIGIGTTNPVANLHVNGGTKVGINGAVFDEIREITGNTGSSGSATYFTYPSGYNLSNTRILNYELWWYDSEWTSMLPTGYSLKSDAIYIFHGDASYFHNKPFRLVIAKIL